MTNKDLDLAREWAKEVSEEYLDHITVDSRAAIKVIQSLPNQIIDAEKVREIYDSYRASEITLHEAFRAAVALIPAPAPRTLADMSLEELKTYVGGEVMVDGWANPTMLVSVIGDEGAVLARRLNKPWPFVEVRPLSDLTSVAAPEQEAENTPEPVQPRPEDVPAGEPWIVQHEDREWIGCRNDPGTRLPWLVIRRDEHQFDYCYDTDTTLISRLVPEVKP